MKLKNLPKGQNVFATPADQKTLSTQKELSNRKWHTSAITTNDTKWRCHMHGSHKFWRKMSAFYRTSPACAFQCNVDCWEDTKNISSNTKNMPWGLKLSWSLRYTYFGKEFPSSSFQPLWWKTHIFTLCGVRVFSFSLGLCNVDENEPAFVKIAPGEKRLHTKYLRLKWNMWTLCKTPHRITEENPKELWMEMAWVSERASKQRQDTESEKCTK